MTSSAVNLEMVATRATSSCRVVEEGERLGDVAGHRAGDDRGVPLGDEEREPAAGAEHLVDRGQCGGGVVDHLEDAVTEHHVGAGGTGQLEQRAEVTLLADHLDAVLAGPASQRGEGVGAGVDHGDPVAEPGHPDREAAGAAADVEHVEAGLLQHGAECLPHHGGAGAVTAFAGRPGHGSNPRALIPRFRGCGARACALLMTTGPWCPHPPA